MSIVGRALAMLRALRVSRSSHLERLTAEEWAAAFSKEGSADVSGGFHIEPDFAQLRKPCVAPDILASFSRETVARAKAAARGHDTDVLGDVSHRTDAMRRLCESTPDDGPSPEREEF